MPRLDEEPADGVDSMHFKAMNAGIAFGQLLFTARAAADQRLYVEDQCHFAGGRPRLLRTGCAARQKILAMRIQSNTLRGMNTFLASDEFSEWLTKLKDRIGKAIIAKRIRAAEAGRLGDCEPVGDGVFEMRIHFGPGYRAYFTRRGEVIYLLLLGGDKSTQKRDIKRAKDMARTLPKE
jgi:putative addiction module killer protein